MESEDHIKKSVISSYIPSLDGIRAVAILVVMLGHFASTLKVSESLLDHHFFYSFLRSTGTGVDLFFVMSGFLITSILLEIKERKGSMFSFWMRRIIRIVPLFFFYLLVLIFLSYIADVRFLQLSQFALYEWVAIFLYFSNLVYLFHGEVSQEFIIFWSLSVEEQFYFVWPLLVKSMDRRDLRQFMLFAIVLAAFFRWGSHAYDPKVDAHYFLLFCRMDSLLIGGLIALFRTYEEFKKERKFIAKWGWPFAVLILLYFVQHKSYHHEAKSSFYIGYYYGVLALAWGVIILNAIEGSKYTEMILANRPIRYVGKVSYGLYIWHPLVGKTTSHFMTQYFNIAKDDYAIQLLVMSLCTLVTASLSYYLLEKPFLKLKKYVPYFGKKKTVT